MSALLRCGMLALSACAAQPAAPTAIPVPAVANETPASNPQWDGPAVRAEFAADGSLRITMTAPTASHELSLQGVVSRNGKVMVQCLHTTPGDAVVAQVLTELVVIVPKDQLPTAAKSVDVEVATARRDRPKDPPSAYRSAATAQRGQ
jgi:hypothetical protein